MTAGGCRRRRKKRRGKIRDASGRDGMDVREREVEHYAGVARTKRGRVRKI